MQRYFGGRGLPFFGSTIPGIDAAKQTDDHKAIAKQAFKVHSLMGQALEVLIPLHIGGGAAHLFMGQNLLRRFF